MKKSDLIKSLEDYPDDAEILLWSWDGHKSRYEYLNLTCTDYKTDDNGNPIHPKYFTFARSFCDFQE